MYSEAKTHGRGSTFPRCSQSLWTSTRTGRPRQAGALRERTLLPLQGMVLEREATSCGPLAHLFFLSATLERRRGKGRHGSSAALTTPAVRHAKEYQKGSSSYSLCFVRGVAAYLTSLCVRISPYHSGFTAWVYHQGQRSCGAQRRRARATGREQEGWLRRIWAEERKLPTADPNGRARSMAAAGKSESRAAPADSSEAPTAEAENSRDQA